MQCLIQSSCFVCLFVFGLVARPLAVKFGIKNVMLVQGLNQISSIISDMCKALLVILWKVRLSMVFSHDDIYYLGWGQRQYASEYQLLRNVG